MFLPPSLLCLVDLFVDVLLLDGELKLSSELSLFTHFTYEPFDTLSAASAG